MPNSANSYEWSDNAVYDHNQLTVQQIALRQSFVAQYLLDYNSYNAALRCGLNGEVAFDYAKKFMQEPYVQQLIASKSVLRPVVDANADIAFKKRQVEEALLREAHFNGAGSSHAARVAALAKLAAFYGLDKTNGDEDDLNKGGVMFVPAEQSLDDWEKEAVESQRKLAEESIKNV